MRNEAIEMNSEIPAEIDRALILTANRFQGVVDKEGKPYILHCLRVMMSESDPNFQLAGLMHDLVEDTPISLDDLRQMGFSELVVEAVACLTHRPEQHNYAEYICHLKTNELARRVKLADLSDNACLSRAPLRPGKEAEDRSRMEKYVLSYQYLESRISQADYLKRMQDG